MDGGRKRHARNGLNGRDLAPNRLIVVRAVQPAQSRMVFAPSPAEASPRGEQPCRQETKNASEKEPPAPAVRVRRRHAVNRPSPATPSRLSSPRASTIAARRPAAP